MSTGGPAGPSVSARDIVAGLRALGICDGARLFVHSSLSAFGHVEGGAPTVCDALREAAGPAGSVAVPTFTWSSYHDREIVTFDVARDPSEVGAVTEAFRLLPGARRSEHLCHSIAATGPLAPDLMGDGVLPFGRGSSMCRLYELDFTCLFLGCGFEACTSLHTVEELAAVPYRYRRDFTGSTVVRADGSRVPSRAREYLRYVPFRNDFEKMEAVFRGRGILTEGCIGAARVTIASMRRIVDIGLGLVRADPGCLLTEDSRALLKSWSGP
jgi:aminoglycoside N3'-acetyltransferase